MNYKKSLYATITIILVLLFVSLASGFPSWFDDSRLPTPRWTFTPKPTLTVPLTRTITIPATVPTAVQTTLHTVNPTPTPDGTSSWFDRSILPTPRVTFTPRPTVTIPFSRTITFPTTKPTPVPTTVPTATTNPANENPWEDCKELTVVTWTGDYEYTVAGAKVYILLKGCPPGQYCKEDYNYFLVGTTDINGKLVLDAETNSNMFRAVSPQYSYYGNIWHFMGTAETDPDGCGCRVDIRLDEKITDVVATPAPVWTGDPDSISNCYAQSMTIKIWTADRQYTVPGAKLYYYCETCPPGQSFADDCYCHLGTTDMEGIAANWGNYVESPLYSRPGEGSWYYTGIRKAEGNAPGLVEPYILLDKKVIVANE